jgi:hypothetical protein
MSAGKEGICIAKLKRNKGSVPEYRVKQTEEGGLSGRRREEDERGGREEEKGQGGGGWGGEGGEEGEDIKEGRTRMYHNDA